MVTGFNRMRPIFRERARLNAELTGRLNEALGGIRVVKAYTAEKREARIFAEGAHKLLRKVVETMVGISTITTISGLLSFSGSKACQMGWPAGCWLVSTRWRVCTRTCSASPRQRCSRVRPS